MPFPLTTGTATNGQQTSNAGSAVFTVPASPVKGELLLFLAGCDGVPASAVITNWTQVATNGVVVGANNTLAVLAKVSDGTEGGTTPTLTWAAGTSEQWKWWCVRVAQWGGNIARDVYLSAKATGSTINPDPGTLTASPGQTDIMWWCLMSIDGSPGATVSTYPTSFTDNQFTAQSGGTSGAGLGICSRNQVATSQNPATFALTQADDWTVVTAAIMPYPPRQEGSSYQNPAALAVADDPVERAGRLYKPKLWRPKRPRDMIWLPGPAVVPA